MNKNQGYDCLIKLLVIGNSGVGKTNILLKYCEGNFMTSHLTTIGIDFKTKSIIVGNDKVRLQIWDTAGQEKFKTITQTYYRGAMGIVLTYSVAERQSYEDIESWVKQIKLHANDNVLKVLIANKADLPEGNRKVSTVEGQALADQMGIKFFETSAKNGTNIEAVFTYMAEQIKKRLQQEERVGVLSYTGSKLRKKDEKNTKVGCC